MATEEYKKRKRDYIKQYNQKTYRSINVLLRMDDPDQKELWDWLHTRYSTAGFLRDQAMKAMKASKEKEKEGK